MRHRRKGRRLGRSSSHRKAMLRNLASSLFLTERDAELDDNAPKVKGRVVTTLHKAKEVRPLVERCITIARQSLIAQEAAHEYATEAERGSESWKSWRQSESWQKWNHAIAPAVAARRQALRLLGDKHAVRVLFEEVAPRMADRDGGYTRVLRLATPRLGDAGVRAILELVGSHDRVKTASEKPEFGTDVSESDDDREAVQDTDADQQSTEEDDESSVEQDQRSSADDEQSSVEEQPTAERTSADEEAADETGAGESKKAAKDD